MLGSEGMLGQTVFDFLSRQGWSVTGTQFVDRAGPWYLDASAGMESWRQLLAEARCNYAINCIGILKPAIGESDAASMEMAIRVNALFPYEVAEAAAECGARVIHMSTDGVFAGGRAEPYCESDAADCTDHYGRSKALGECPAANVLNIRCSIIGRDAVERKGILEWFLRQPDGGVVDGFCDQRWNGVTTLQFARLCGAIIDNDIFEKARSVSRVHHFCPNPVTTKHDLLCAWQAVTGKRVTVRPVESLNPGANRVLATQYGCFPSICASPVDWREILSELPTTIRQS